MTAARPEEDCVEVNDDALDDLTVIDGIGAARQRWLREAFSIVTFADLAALSVSEIKERLRDERKTVSGTKIEWWLAQARNLVHSTQTVGELGSKAPVDATRCAVSEDQESRETLARFLIELRDDKLADANGPTLVTIRNLETFDSITWSDFSPRKICNWIIAELGDKASAKVQLDEAMESRPFFSRELEQSIGKTQRLAGDEYWTPAQAPIRRQTSPTRPLAAGGPTLKPRSAEGTETEKDPPYSDRLQQVMVKAHRLSEAND